MRIRSYSKLAFLFVVLFALGMQNVHAQTNPGGPIILYGAGIYKGSYSSYATGGDYGTVTIIVSNQGSTACDFHSTPNNTDVIATSGSVSSNSPYLALTCAQAGINFGGIWGANTDSSSVAGESLSGTWISAGGIGPYTTTGTFTAAFVSALTPLNPAAITGLWYQPSQSGDGFNFLLADAGLVVTYYGQTSWNMTTTSGTLVGAPMYTPYWMISDVGPATVLPGTTITFNLSAPPNPPPAQIALPPVTPVGSLAVVFFDCKLATATFSPTSSFFAGGMTWYLQKLAGVANGPGC